MEYKVGDRVLCDPYAHNGQKELAIGIVAEPFSSEVGVRVRGGPNDRDVRFVHRPHTEIYPIPPNCTIDQIRAFVHILGRELLE